MYAKQTLVYVVIVMCFAIYWTYKIIKDKIE